MSKECNGAGKEVAHLCDLRIPCSDGIEYQKKSRKMMCCIICVVIVVIIILVAGLGSFFSGAIKTG